MLRLTIITLFLLSQSTPAWATSSCYGSNLALTSATVKGVTPAGALNQYQIGATVTNLGNAPEPNNTLQFVNMYQAEVGEKLDAKGVPPLMPGQSYTVTYTYQRSRDAGNGTTKLAFQLAPVQPACLATANDRQTVVF